MLFQSQDKLAFHIGAKHNQVEAILKAKGIPIPIDPTLPSDPNKNLETPSALAGPSTSAPQISEPGPDPRSPETSTAPVNEQPTSAPGPGNSTSVPGNVGKEAAAGGKSCAGVNYELNCQV